MPAVSIITINLNNSKGLQQTMQSVFAQTFPDYEYIVIDGASEDGSKEYIEQHAEKLTHWISEKDSGIYNAMNKGIARARGEYLLFLNSGDYFYNPESLHLLSKKTGDRKIVYGNVLVNEKDGKEWVYKFPDELSFGFFNYTNLPHQATLIKKELFQKIGLYDERYKVVSDWKFCMDAICKYNCTYQHVNETIAVFNTGGISTNPETKELIANEREDVFKNGYVLFMREYKEYFQIKSEVNNYRNSRMHQFVNRIITSAWYKRIKR